MDLNQQTQAAADAIYSIKGPLEQTVRNLKTLLQSLAQVISNKATRKDRFKVWYALFAAEEASFGAVRKSFGGLAALLTDNQKPSTTVSLVGTSSSAKATATAPAAPYVIRTKRGTSLGDFKSFIIDLDDAGGKQYSALMTNFQSYIAFLNPSQIAKAKANPIVKFCVPNQNLTVDRSRSLVKAESQKFSRLRSGYVSKG